MQNIRLNLALCMPLGWMLPVFFSEPMGPVFLFFAKQEALANNMTCRTCCPFLYAGWLDANLAFMRSGGYSLSARVCNVTQVNENGMMAST
jgi:hypothetical protein